MATAMDNLSLETRDLAHIPAAGATSYGSIPIRLRTVQTPLAIGDRRYVAFKRAHHSNGGKLCLKSFYARA